MKNSTRENARGSVSNGAGSLRRFSFSLTVAFAFLLAFAGAVQAAVSDEEVELFASASIAVENVTDRYEAKLEDASEEEQQSLVMEMTEEMQQAVADSGLEWNRYQDIVFEAGSDEALNERIIQEIERQR